MLISSEIVFSWHKSPESRWVEASPVNDDWTYSPYGVTQILVPTASTATENEALQRSENPLLKSESGLFRILSQLEPTKDAIQVFAAEYGPLTRGRLCIPAGWQGKCGPPPTGVSLFRADFGESRESNQAKHWKERLLHQGAVCGDSLQSWTQTIEDLKTTIEIWEALRNKNLAILGQHIQFQKQGDLATISTHGEAALKLFPVRVNYLASQGPRNLLEAAEFILNDVINQRIAICAQFQVPSRTSTPRNKHLCFQPHSLLDAIWLQLALAYIENKQFRSCTVCGRPFEVSPQVARTNRLLCSAACKAKSHRERRKLALALAKEGLDAKQIAKQVGSKLSTVSKWLLEESQER